MKVRQRIHRRATYNRPESRFRVVYKTLTAGLDSAAAHCYHLWTFVGPPAPYEPVSQIRMDFTFYPKEFGEPISMEKVMDVVKKLPPIAGIIDVTKG